jgi:hypothetical protein
VTAEDNVGVAGDARRRGALLVRDPRVLDLDAVRLAAASRGWRVVLERLDGTPVPERVEEPPRWFADALRLRVEGDDVDAAVLVEVSPGLELDTARRPDPRG